MTKSRKRKTPWDTPSLTAKTRSSPPSHRDPDLPAREPVQDVICMQGLWVFDPMASTSEDARNFLWTGLQLLRTKAKSLELTDDEVRQLMLTSFTAFHDAANGLWGALQEMTAKGGCGSLAAVEACCQISTGHGSGRLSLPAPRNALVLPSPNCLPVPVVPNTCEGVGPLAATAPLLETESTNMTSEVESYPVADFPEPTEFGWTPEGYEVRAAFKRYSESNHADR
ncbi:hypothetical protein J8F10_23965 [Gemmata sp. G18]|uniref:Uncharacterized protein n=1 Tax=Gemmata palustris TaxID=2822762 RepID=A0ABS5BX82_9BACT|nr:hypothetical protein [Gemmata palustris]MBP3958316.1 hypothetical protein [Gemmata palustris]